MRYFKAPDIHAPRFKPKSTHVLTVSFLKKFKKEHPEFEDVSMKDLRNIIGVFNTELWKSVIDTRDGVELPEQLGYIFLGRCLPKIKANTNFKTSKEAQQIVEHKNWNSNDFLLKIFYTNYQTKYRFVNHEIWSFQADRSFSRTASEAFREIWSRCIHIDHTLQITDLFRKRIFKQASEEYKQRVIETYDEFEL